jgi:hypothetical protein
MKVLFENETEETKAERQMLIDFALTLIRRGVQVEFLDEYSSLFGEYRDTPFVLSYVHGHLEVCVDKEVKAELIHLLSGEEK